ncbi:hypothetical protein [Chryseobacterium cucumeris]|uniref:hypothetical protein n=1 Tax=Chryseobacterium cucumeris TaxID=1813611 RepID=UPI001F4B044D|nr:hypothetical protein [Chryseobacterium cucumeris]
MDKPTKKRLSYNTEIIKALSAAYEFSEYFIRECIRGNKKSLTADKIRKEYNEMNNPSVEKLQQFQKNT